MLYISTDLSIDHFDLITILCSLYVHDRLFFLSNEELVGLLCESDSRQLDRHLRKCFDGIHSLMVSFITFNIKFRSFNLILI